MTTTNKLGPGGMIVAGIIMVIVSVVIILLQANEMSIRAQAEAAREWNTVQATVLESRPDELRQSIETEALKWVPYVRYSYTIDGEEYTGERFKFLSPGRDGLRKITATNQLKGYPVGKTITIHVDPVDSTNSVIKPGLHRSGGGWLFMGMAGDLGLAGIALAIFGAIMKFGLG